ncbi:YgdI/YgdR family lipoprotein [Halopseudomonas phragmitis]|uniref:Lipoprotein YgdI/YgdR-like SH3-like domain-containing protein n=2 Tax=Pseudomonadaceae TaxID=135621 RepID=A0A1V0B6X8_9GAMM|nr:MULTISPECIES: YgdI/YgdR family lipoprotein [Pseudomonadaceae]AQZ95667.1 hypothetical protein BVH74_13315 [Halopseudomonas phragmitis]PAU87215.1 YgdI/YgdR family lipoprotein [Pseudomonas sp. WN033]RHW22634.1 YgdI/YgdR family lipoprotein [Pseudomonas jilinensis]
MKQSLVALICAAAFLVLAGCAKDHLIATHDGRLIETDNKPKIDDDTGMIEYKDYEGRVNQIPQSEVREIKER